MIEVKRTGKCAECPCFDLKVDRYYIDGGECMCVCSCKNATLCDHLEQYLRKEDVPYA